MSSAENIGPRMATRFASSDGTPASTSCSLCRSRASRSPSSTRSGMRSASSAAPSENWEIAAAMSRGGRRCHPGLLPEAEGEGGAAPVHHAVGYVGGGDLTVQAMLAHLLAEALAQRCWEVPLQLAGEVGVLRSVGG